MARVHSSSAVGQSFIESSHHYDGLAAESQRRRVFFWGIKKGVDLFKERLLCAVKDTKAVTVGSLFPCFQ